MATNDPFVIVGIIIVAFFSIVFGLTFILGMFLTLSDKERRNGR